MSAIKGTNVTLKARVMLTVSCVLVIGVAAVLVSPATLSYPPTTGQVLVSVLFVAAVLLVVWLGLSRSLRPFQEFHDQISGTQELADAQPVTLREPAPELADMAQVYNQLLARLQAEQLASRSAVLVGQEAERLRIARELHDQIGQSLTYALLAVQAAADAYPEAADRLELSREAVRTSLTEVRTLASNLRPGPLEDLGLAAAVSSLATAHAEATGVLVHRAIATVPGTTHEQELVVYRIAQESLTNIARHAQAHRVWVQLAGDDRQLRLTVTDDGIGLPTDTAGSGPTGSGLAGMRDRAELVGGRLLFDSQPQVGTVVRLVVPLAPADPSPPETTERSR